MKKLILFLLVTASLILMAACHAAQDRMNPILSDPKTPILEATVTEVKEGYFLCKEYGTEQLFQVSQDAAYPEDCTAYAAGDRVLVYYNGIVAEIYPGLINEVYAIVRIDPGK